MTTKVRSRNMRKRREQQHARRQTAHDAVDPAAQVPGDLAPVRGDGVGTASSPATPTPVDGGVASDTGDHANAGVTSTPDHDTAPAPTTSAHDAPPPDQHATTSTPAAPDHNTYNNNNGSNNQQATPQASQHTTPPQQPQSHTTSSPSHDNVYTPQNQNTNRVSSTSSVQQHDTAQQPSSPSSQGDAANVSQSAEADGALTAAAPSGSVALVAAASATTPAATVNGIVDTTNTLDEDASAASAPTKTSKLGAGGTAGIVIAIVAVIALIGAFFLYRKRQREKNVRRTRQYGNVRIMSQRYSTGSSFYGVHNVSSGSGGFITFQDNASTRTGATTLMPGSPSGGSITYNAPAPAPRAASLLSRNEGFDEDDLSQYDHETVDSHGDMGQASAAYYNTAIINPFEEHHGRMPEYNLPIPPIPAFNGEEAILASKASSNSMAYLASGQSPYRRTEEARRPLNRSVSSQNSYVDEQLRDLYVENL
ncbi:hypothetical protein P389DRAFT_87537 [Cystobasidium minutum MCA 4210]|uniref:uncharacterized protein n=1 Tax=Cystobasidium minutum MCA 4210 TaxID=1397322 RepID=UPI0034CD0BBA|eukprot:jgi/Rhomi1/87537/CE87536_411